MLSLIVAMDENNLIGHNNTMPWNCPEDLKLFKDITSNNIVIMGRKTFESIGKALPNRFNIVLTKTSDFFYEGIDIYDCPIKAVEEARFLQKTYNKKIFVIGGKSIYQYFLPLISELHISYIKGKYIGDTYFPDIDLAQFKVIQKIDYNDFTYIKYTKNTCNF